jgi:DNA replication protein DnaC
MQTTSTVWIPWKSVTLDSIKNSLVALRMPRALEVLDATLRRIEQGEIDGIEALDQLLVEELTVRESRRIKTALTLGRLTTVKTLAGFDFVFQPSLDRNRILALAELKFIDHAEVVHLLGPPGTGKSHLATALAVEAVKAGRSVYFSTLADIIASLAAAEREGQLRQRLRYLCRAALLVVDEIGYLPVIPGGGNLFFQRVNARYEKGAMILTSNRGFAEWGEVFGDPSSPPRCSTAFSTMPSSSRSKDRATGSVSMLTSCPSTSAPKPTSPRRPPQNAAAGRQQRKPTITITADHRPNPNPPTREI